MTDVDAKSQFILHWGDMGTQWGVNRSVAQIHALLYLSSEPINAEEISRELGIARSNVSNSLKELITWRLIKRVPVQGDRREHFEAETDVWEMATLISKGRKEREIDPALLAIDSCLSRAKEQRDIDPTALKRMEDMSAFLRAVDDWYSQMLQVPRSKLMALIKLGSRVISLVGLASRRSD